MGTAAYEKAKAHLDAMLTRTGDPGEDGQLLPAGRVPDTHGVVP